MFTYCLKLKISYLYSHFERMVFHFSILIVNCLHEPHVSTFRISTFNFASLVKTATAKYKMQSVAPLQGYDFFVQACK